MVKMKMMMTMREEEMMRDQDHLFRYRINIYLTIIWRNT